MQEMKNAYTTSFTREHYEDLGVDGTVMRSYTLHQSGKNV